MSTVLRPSALTGASLPRGHSPFYAICYANVNNLQWRVPRSGDIRVGVTYRDDYEKEKAKLRALIVHRDRLVPKILAARRRVVALATLLGQPQTGPTFSVEMVGLGRGRLTEVIRYILAASDEPLSAKMIEVELERLGFPIKEHSNPSASINSICNRLVEQGTAKEADLPGKKGKAWKRVAKFEEMTPEDQETFVRTRGL